MNDEAIVESFRSRLGQADLTDDALLDICLEMSVKAFADEQRSWERKIEFLRGLSEVLTPVVREMKARPAIPGKRRFPARIHVLWDLHLGLEGYLNSPPPPPPKSLYQLECEHHWFLWHHWSYWHPKNERP